MPSTVQSKAIPDRGRRPDGARGTSGDSATATATANSDPTTIEARMPTSPSATVIVDGPAPRPRRTRDPPRRHEVGGR